MSFFNYNLKYRIISQCFANTCTIEYKVLGVVNNLIIERWYKCFNKHFEMRFNNRI